ncbi:hypothetical protein B9Z55_016131 [Caenorhabditis nigoni]|uniref:Uncharacterized protein n=1 Tax=Caenorhabditis nigoni TaxID=1611254 RepID=A0A2G5UDA3_9PELO|nr:hypothetical protein B9Z55_016131 [Caenorhabditis nigoni]
MLLQNDSAAGRPGNIIYFQEYHGESRVFYECNVTTFRPAIEQYCPKELQDTIQFYEHGFSVDKTRLDIFQPGEDLYTNIRNFKSLPGSHNYFGVPLTEPHDNSRIQFQNRYGDDFVYWQFNLGWIQSITANSSDPEDCEKKKFVNLKERYLESIQRVDEVGLTNIPRSNQELLEFLMRLLPKPTDNTDLSQLEELCNNTWLKVFQATDGVSKIKKYLRSVIINLHGTNSLFSNMPAFQSGLQYKKIIGIFEYGKFKFGFRYEVLMAMGNREEFSACMDSIKRIGPQCRRRTAVVRHRHGTLQIEKDPKHTSEELGPRAGQRVQFDPKVDIIGCENVTEESNLTLEIIDEDIQVYVSRPNTSEPTSSASRKSISKRREELTQVTSSGPSSTPIIATSMTTATQQTNSTTTTSTADTIYRSTEFPSYQLSRLQCHRQHMSQFPSRMVRQNETSTDGINSRRAPSIIPTFTRSNASVTRSFEPNGQMMVETIDEDIQIFVARPNISETTSSTSATVREELTQVMSTAGNNETSTVGNNPRRGTSRIPVPIRSNALVPRASRTTTSQIPAALTTRPESRVTRPSSSELNQQMITPAAALSGSNASVPTSASSSSSGITAATSQHLPTHRTGRATLSISPDGQTTSSTSGPSNQTGGAMWFCVLCNTFLGGANQFGIGSRKAHLRIIHNLSNYSTCVCHQWTFESVLQKDLHNACYTPPSQIEGTDYSPIVYLKSIYRAGESGTANRADKRPSDNANAVGPHPKRVCPQPSTSNHTAQPTLQTL